MLWAVSFVEILASFPEHNFRCCADFFLEFMDAFRNPDANSNSFSPDGTIGEYCYHFPTGKFRKNNSSVLHPYKLFSGLEIRVSFIGDPESDEGCRFEYVSCTILY